MHGSHRRRARTAFATPQAHQEFPRTVHAPIANNVFDSAELRVMSTTQANSHEYPFIRDFREHIFRVQQRTIAVYIAASWHDSYRGLSSDAEDPTPLFAAAVPS